jgi:hypothetical protein
MGIVFQNFVLVPLDILEIKKRSKNIASREARINKTRKRG